LADLDENADDLMAGVLQLGTQRLPTTDLIDRILADGDWLGVQD
jgi:hypothetical protein